MKRSSFALIALASPFLLSACASSNDDLQSWMDSEGAKLKGQVAPLPPVAPFTPVAYIGRDMTDPFSPKKSTKASAAAPDAKRKKDFLESFSLDRLSMVGTIKRKGMLWGLVRAPDGTISMVKPGDYMGQNFGKIVEVKDSGLLLKEAVLDPQGDWTDRDVDFTIVNQK